MSVSTAMLKAAVFMDHSNVASPILKKKEYRGYVINYGKFLKILLHGYKNAGASAFMGVTKPVKPQKQKFIRYLIESGFNTFERELIERKGSFVQKGLDTFMSLFIENVIHAFDVAIIVSGDADFLVIAEILMNSQKFVHIWSWKDAMSIDLLRLVGEDNVFYIDDIWDRIKIKRKKNDPHVLSEF